MLVPAAHGLLGEGGTPCVVAIGQTLDLGSSENNTPDGFWMLLTSSEQAHCPQGYN